MTTTLYKITKQTIKPLIISNGIESKISVNISTPLCLRNGYFEQSPAIIKKMNEAKREFGDTEYFIEKYTPKMDLQLQTVFETKPNFSGWYDDSYHCADTQETTTEEFGVVIKSGNRWRVFTNKFAVESLRRKANIINMDRGSLHVEGINNSKDYLSELHNLDSAKGGLYFRGFNGLDSDLDGSGITIVDATAFLLSHQS